MPQIQQLRELRYLYDSSVKFNEDGSIDMQFLMVSLFLPPLSFVFLTEKKNTKKKQNRKLVE